MATPPSPPPAPLASPSSLASSLSTLSLREESLKSSLLSFFTTGTSPLLSLSPSLTPAAQHSATLHQYVASALAETTDLLARTVKERDDLAARQAQQHALIAEIDACQVMEGAITILADITRTVQTATMQTATSDPATISRCTMTLLHLQSTLSALTTTSIEYHDRAYTLPEIQSTLATLLTTTTNMASSTISSLLPSFLANPSPALLPPLTTLLLPLPLHSSTTTLLPTLLTTHLLTPLLPTLPPPSPLLPFLTALLTSLSPSLSLLLPPFLLTTPPPSPLTTTLVPFLLLTLKSHNVYRPKSAEDVWDTWTALLDAKPLVLACCLGPNPVAPEHVQLLQTELDAVYPTLTDPINGGVYYQLLSTASLTNLTAVLANSGSSDGFGSGDSHAADVFKCLTSTIHILLDRHIGDAFRFMKGSIGLIKKVVNWSKDVGTPAVAWELTVLATVVGNEFMEKCVLLLGEREAGMRETVEQVIDIIVNDIDEVITGIYDKIGNRIVVTCGEKLPGVRAIAATYRMTNREPPTSCSFYVETLLRELREFLTENEGRVPYIVEEGRWVGRVVGRITRAYRESVVELFDMVKGASGSLRKKKGKGGLEDGEKVELQIWLDVCMFEEKVKEVMGEEKDEGVNEEVRALREVAEPGRALFEGQ